MEGLESQRGEVYQSLEKSATAAVNASLLLLGGEGTGKTMTVEHVLLHLKQNMSKEGRIGFVAVRLNGLVHADETVALKEIENQLKGEEQQFGSLSSVADNMEYLKRVLKETKRVGIPVFFILDNVDAFIAENNRQSLLYTLFDMMNDPQVAASIICCTRKINITNMLEKRIRSRANFKFVHFFPQSLINVTSSLKAAFSFQIPDLSSENGKLFVSTFQEIFVESLGHKSLQSKLKEQVDIGRPFSWYFEMIRVACAMLDQDHVFLTSKEMIEAIDFLANDPSYSKVLDHCAVPELVLLVCMIQLERKNIVTYESIF